MRKTIIISLTLLLSSITAVGQEHKERSAPPPRPPQTQTQPQSQPPGGLRYSSPEGRYTVSLPKQPTLSTQNITAPDGSPVTQYLAMSGEGAPLFMVAYFDYPSGIVFSLDKGRDGMISSINGTLLDEQSMSLGGAPGRHIKIAAKTEQGMEFIDRARFYDIRPRVYVLQCIVPKAIDTAAMGERCDQFFDSFRVRSTP